jgi:hypothetical protein
MRGYFRRICRFGRTVPYNVYIPPYVYKENKTVLYIYVTT